jgi:pyrimidine operon attenuation protein / uracil phosphoribosyltransferase
VSARQIMTADDVRRAITRIGHEIVERHGQVNHLALFGVERRGSTLAARLAEAIAAASGTRPPVGSIDVTPWRDDRPRVRSPVGDHDSVPPTTAGALPFDPSAMTVVLVDDVLFTGRTVRAAMQALTDQGRPAAVRVAVLVDRGHRELPIRADHVGRNIPTARHEDVQVRLREVDGGDDEVVVTAGIDTGPKGENDPRA